MNLSFVLIPLLVVSSLQAQSSPPAGWRALADRDLKVTTAEPTTDAEWRFTPMAPGWHITTRPAAMMYDPGIRASGNFVIESMQILFPGTSNAGYGVFLGGQNLETDSRRLTAFLLHRDGTVSVERHDGKQITILVAPTRAASYKPAPAGDTADNLLRVSAAPDSVRISVNGTVAAAIPRAGLLIDGQFGFRTGSDLNLHVTTLDYTQRFAPVPRRVP